MHGSMNVKLGVVLFSYKVDAILSVLIIHVEFFVWYRGS